MGEVHRLILRDGVEAVRSKADSKVERQAIEAAALVLAEEENRLGITHARDGEPEIPTKKNRRIQHTVNRALYATRNSIERFFNRLKNSRRVATRFDQTASSFLGFAKLVTIKQWISFVHAT